MPPSPFHHHLMSPRHTKDGAKAYGRLMSWRQLKPGPRLSGFIHLPSATEEAGGSPPQEPAAVEIATAEQQRQEPVAAAAAVDGAAALAAKAAADGAAQAAAAAQAAGAGAANGAAAAAAQPAIAALLPVGRPPEPASGDGNRHPSWAKLPAQIERLALQEAVLWEPPDAATVSRHFPPTIHLPLPPPSGRLQAARSWLHERTGFTAEHTALALQLAVAVAGASALHVTRESYEALKERTVWIVVTGGGCGCCAGWGGVCCVR